MSYAAGTAAMFLFMMGVIWVGSSCCPTSLRSMASPVFASMTT